MQKTSRKLLLLLLAVAITVPASLTFLGCSSNDKPESESKNNTEPKNNTDAKSNADSQMASSNNLKQIAIAMQNHVSAYGHFPQRANFSKDGKPLLSWRVRILPFIEQKTLYDQFHLDEPWDSPHNKKLIESMPDIYRNPNSPDLAANGKTNYVVPTGPGSIFEGQNKTRFRDVQDGLSNTILAFEINPDKAVIWTKPDDLDYDKSNTMVNLGKAQSGGFMATLGDGSILFLPDTLDPETLLRFFQIKDGKPIDHKNFRTP